MAMRFKPKGHTDATKTRTLTDTRKPADGHPYMPHHSFYASAMLRKKRAKRQQLQIRKKELESTGHFMTSNYPFSGSHDDRTPNE